MKKLLPLLLLAAALTARADSIDISGTATVSQTMLSFTFFGPSLFVSSPAPDGNGFVAICSQGTICDVTRFVAAVNTFCPSVLLCPANASYNGITVTWLIGGITFAGTTFVPVAAENTFSQFIVPVTFTGEVSGFTTDPVLGGSQVFDFLLAGSGTLTSTAIASGGKEIFLSGSYAYSGTATPTPEPASLALFASGLAGMGALLRQRRRKSLRGSKG